MGRGGRGGGCADGLSYSEHASNPTTENKSTYHPAAVDATVPITFRRHQEAERVAGKEGEGGKGGKGRGGQ